MNSVTIDQRGYPAEMKTEIDPVTQKPREVLNVYGVEVMGRMPSTSHPSLLRAGMEIDDSWMQLAYETYRQGTLKQKTPELLLGHNKDGAEAPSIGSLENMRYERPYMVADLRVTNPEAQAMLLRGELRHRSAEFVPSNHHIWGLSLTKGESGHFEEEFPDLVLRPAETRTALHNECEVVCLSWRPTNQPNTETMKMDNGMRPPMGGNGGDGGTIQETLAAIQATLEQQGKAIADLQQANKAGVGEMVDATTTPDVDEEEMQLVESEVAEQMAARSMENGMSEEEAKQEAQLACKDKAREMLSTAHGQRIALKRRTLMQRLVPQVAQATGMSEQAARLKLAAARDIDGLQDRAKMLRERGKPTSTQAPADQAGRIGGETLTLSRRRNSALDALEAEVVRLCQSRGVDRVVALSHIRENKPQMIELAQSKARTIYSNTSPDHTYRVHG